MYVKKNLFNGTLFIVLYATEKGMLTTEMIYMIIRRQCLLHKFGNAKLSNFELKKKTSPMFYQDTFNKELLVIFCNYLIFMLKKTFIF